MVWPAKVGEGGSYREHIPDCRNGGQHRFGAIHFLPVDKSVMVRVCRTCEAERFLKFELKDGKLLEINLKPDNLPCNISKSIDNK